MTRFSVFCVLTCMVAIGTARADHYQFYYPGPVLVAPVVSYQPAYVVPIGAYAVTTGIPVTTVSYGTSYYAPLVPMVGVAPVAPVVYSVPAYVAPAYSVPVFSVPVFSAPVYGGYYGYSVHSRLNVRRNGNYNYHLRVR